MMQSSVTDYFKAKKRVRDDTLLLAKSAKRIATAAPDGTPIPFTHQQQHSSQKEEEGEGKGEVKVKGDEGVPESRVVVPFVHKGKLSPKKVAPPPPLDLKRLLKNKTKLADLQAALKGLNGCANKLSELRRNAAPTATPATPATPSLEVTTPEKFYSPRKVTDIFSSPTKLSEIGSSSNNNNKKGQSKKRLFQDKTAPAYQRFSSLAAPPIATGSGCSVSDDLPLPYKYKLLEELFVGMETVASILHNRKELITYSKVRVGVAELVRRVGLRQTHIAQFLTVFPNAYALSHEKIGAQFQLVITVKLENDNFTATDMTQRKRCFHDNLLNIAHRHHHSFLSGLSPSVLVPEGKKVTRWHPKFNVDGVEDVEAAFIPRCPDNEKVSSAKDVINRAQSLLENANPRMKKAVEDMLARQQTQPPKEKKKKEEGKKTIAALKGISQALIDKIRAREAEKSVCELTVSAEERTRKSMLARLPEFVRIIRNTFVAEKKAALPLDTAIERIVHSKNHTMTSSEVESHVRVLCGVLPEWVRLCRLSGGGEYMKIDRGGDINQLILKLQTF